MPVVAVVDSNCDPDGISHPIPGNDDAGRAITLYCDLIARAAIDGIERAQGAVGVDLGAAEEPLGEPGTEGEEVGSERPQADRRPKKKPAGETPGAPAAADAEDQEARSQAQSRTSPARARLKSE